MPITYLKKQLFKKKKRRNKKGKAKMKYKSDNLHYSHGLKLMRGCETVSEKAIVCSITVLGAVASFSVLRELV